MGNIDRSDQHLSDYPVAKKKNNKQIEKCSTCLLWLFGILTLYTKSDKPKLLPLQYRAQIVKKIIENYKPECPSAKPGRPYYSILCRTLSA